MKKIILLLVLGVVFYSGKVGASLGTRAKEYIGASYDAARCSKLGLAQNVCASYKGFSRYLKKKCIHYRTDSPCLVAFCTKYCATHALGEDDRAACKKYCQATGLDARTASILREKITEFDSNDPVQYMFDLKEVEGPQAIGARSNTDKDAIKKAKRILSRLKEIDQLLKQRNGYVTDIERVRPAIAQDAQDAREALNRAKGLQTEVEEAASKLRGEDFDDVTTIDSTGKRIRVSAYADRLKEVPLYEKKFAESCIGGVVSRTGGFFAPTRRANAYGYIGDRPAAGGSTLTSAPLPSYEESQQLMPYKRD